MVSSSGPLGMMSLGMVSGYGLWDVMSLGMVSLGGVGSLKGLVTWFPAGTMMVPMVPMLPHRPGTIMVPGGNHGNHDGIPGFSCIMVPTGNHDGSRRGPSR